MIKTISMNTVARMKCGNLRLVNTKGDWFCYLEDTPNVEKRLGITPGDKVKLTFEKM